MSTGQLKAVVLAGGPGTATCPLIDCYPPLLFPMLDGQPLLYHLFGYFKVSGIREVAVALSSRTQRHQQIVNLLSRIPASELQVHWSADRGNRGSGGAVKDLEWFIDSAPTLLLYSNIWPEGIDLASIWSEHRRSGAAITMVLEAMPYDRNKLENAKIERDGVIKSFTNLHESRDNRRHLRPAGVYLIEPEVLSLMEPDVYIDLKEQLISWLNEDGYPVRGYVLDAPLARFENASEYFSLNQRLMLDRWSEREPDRDPGQMDYLLPRAYPGDGTRISPNASILGPVTIGKNCTIADDARVVGPAIICDGTTIGERALVRDSIIWPGCRLAPGSAVEYSLVTESCAIATGQRVIGAVVDSGEVLKQGLKLANAAGTPILVTSRRGRAQQLAPPPLIRTAYLVVKRALDIVVPIIALPILTPLMVMIAIAIKLDSRGPIFYRQVRCREGGREFTLYKFRTMVESADALHAALRDKNDAKGPIFKMKRDPRTTRIGPTLRRTSMDELPQLWNVLRGEMSLVGPRPLAIHEMLWCPRWRDIRLKAKPGLTGLWQVSARGDFGFEGWIENDIMYVKNQSLWLDLRIMVKTVRVLLSRPTGT